MNQQDFEQRNSPAWSRLDAMLVNMSKKIPPQNAGARSEFPHLYRQVCHHLAIARERQYTTHLIDRLNQLMLQGHQYLYSARAGNFSHLLGFIGGGFSALIRREAGLFWLALGLFLLPAVILGLSVYFWPEMIYTLMDSAQVSQFDSMYSPDATHIGRRGADDDVAMFGFYIYNNIGIGFRTFAGGMLYGLGSIFFLFFNGLHIGAVAGYLTQRGYVNTFWPFVIGHGAFELTAIVFAGMAGLKIGFAMLAPGRKTRLAALIDAGRISIKIIYGVIAMLVIAAFLEAFWSSIKLISPQIKYAVGAGLWLFVIVYFLLLGRGRAD
ncbi:MAG: stage II sporulation protein M [Gammaproteobacteria bacterium]|nr:stage II sporulation protein M [Gammaproteobacteria bacterium]